MTSLMSTNTVRNALWDRFGGDALPLLLTIEVRNHYRSNTLLIDQLFQLNISYNQIVLCFCVQLSHLAIKTPHLCCQIVNTSCPSDKKKFVKSVKFSFLGFSLVPLNRTILKQAMKARLVFDI